MPESKVSTQSPSPDYQEQPHHCHEGSLVRPDRKAACLQHPGRVATRHLTSAARAALPTPQATTLDTLTTYHLQGVRFLTKADLTSTEVLIARQNTSLTQRGHIQPPPSAASACITQRWAGSQHSASNINTKHTLLQQGKRPQYSSSSPHRAPDEKSHRTEATLSKAAPQASRRQQPAIETLTVAWKSVMPFMQVS